MYERYTASKSIAAGTQNIEPHDAVLLTYKAPGATQLIPYSGEARRGTNGRVVPNQYGNEGFTGDTITIDGVANDQAQMILPIQIKSTGTLTGHEVHILFK